VHRVVRTSVSLSSSARRRSALGALITALALLAPGAALGEGESPGPATPQGPSGAAAPSARPVGDFIRIRKDDADRMLALETAIAHYVKPTPRGEPVSVDLVAAVHIGERAYYEALNREFEQYDALLYELVAPEGTRVEGAQEKSGVSSLQGMLAESLELDFQLQHVDYTRPNFVHADMSADELLESMVRNREDPREVFVRLLGYSMIAQGPSDLSILLAYISSDRVMRLRRVMAAQLVKMDFLELILAGEEGASLLTHRNGKAVEVLERELAAGRRRVAIFYGAGHLPDLDARLTRDLGFERESQRWIHAWTLRSDATPAPAPP